MLRSFTQSIRSRCARTAAWSTLLAVTCLVVPPAVLAATPPDAVVKAVLKAEKRKAITGSERREYLQQWRYSTRQAKVLSAAGKVARAGEIGHVRNITLGLARRSQLTAERLPATFANLAATTYIMKSRPYPTHEARIQIPGDPVVYGFYSGRGVQFQPLFTFSLANILYGLHDDAGLREIADRLNELKVTGRGYATWEYYFPFQGGNPPWVSGMAQATAIQVFARTWERTGDQKYLDIARSGLTGFSRTPAQGGFMTYQGGGRWYLLYGFASRQRILNGQLQALIGLFDYYEITNDEQARERLNQGIAGVLPIMSKFDTGAWSLYELNGLEAELNYHDLMTSQLKKLYNRTTMVEFADQAHRFETYRATPPQVVVPTQALLPVYPVLDGFRDSFRLKYFVDKRARHVIRIQNGDGTLISTVPNEGTVVRTIRNDGPRGNFTLEWDGRDEHGDPVPAGGYTIHFTTTDIIGNRREGQLTQLIEVKRDVTAPQPVSVKVKTYGAHKTQIVLRVTDAESPYVVVKVQRRGKVLATRRMAGKLAFIVNAPIAKVRGGFLLLTDTSGNQRRIDI